MSKYTPKELIAYIKGTPWLYGKDHLILDLAKRVEVLSKALEAHNNWHLTLIDPDPEWGYIPSVEYSESSLYERTNDALKATDLTKWMELPQPPKERSSIMKTPLEFIEKLAKLYAVDADELYQYHKLKERFSEMTVRDIYSAGMHQEEQIIAKMAHDYLEQYNQRGEEE